MIPNEPRYKAIFFVNRYMLDTNLFNQVADCLLPLDKLRSLNLYATHVQLDELAATKDPTRRAKLLETFHKLSPEQMPTHSAVWDVSASDQAGWGDQEGLFEKMLVRLKECDQKKKEKKPIENQQRDILIAETAIKHGLTLITNDHCLQKVAEEFGCTVSQAPSLLA